MSPDTLRHYELKGLLESAPRSANGYREYPPEACTRVRMVRRAVALGFTLDELASIVKVRDRGGAPCSRVRALAGEKLALLEGRVVELQEACDRLRAVLSAWDVRLAQTPSGVRAALLDALEGLVDPGAPSPLVPHALRRPGAGPLPSTAPRDGHSRTGARRGVTTEPRRKPSRDRR